MPGTSWWVPGVRRRSDRQGAGTADFASLYRRPRARRYLQIANETIVPRASIAQLEAQTDDNIYVSPDRLKRHPLVPKAWGRVQSNGTVLASAGVSSVVRNSAGLYTINWSQAFSSANYAVLLTAFGSSSSEGINYQAVAQYAGSVQVSVVFSGTGNVDRDFSIAALGDR